MIDELLMNRNFTAEEYWERCSGTRALSHDELVRQTAGMRNMSEEELQEHYYRMYPGRGLAWAMNNAYAPKPPPRLPYDDVQ